MSKKIQSYEIINHGVEHGQYFQGCGVSHTQYEECFTGAANSPRDALDEALEQAAMSGWDLESDADLRAEYDNLSDESTVEHGADECWHYVSIRLR